MLDRESFARYAERYIDMIFRVAYSYTKSREDAEDVCQDTLLKLYATDTVFQSEEHVRRWLIRVAVNACKTLFRSPWRRMEPIEEYAQSLGFVQEDHSELFTAVMALDRKYRLPLYLYYYEGYSVREIGALLALPEKTVSTRLFRARARLRAVLEEE